MSGCRETKPNGEPCKGSAVGSHGYCWHHAPENAERRRVAASRAGRSKVPTEVKALREQLQTLTQQVVDGEIETGRGAVANQLITTQIKLLEFERRVKETDQLEAEIAELKREYGNAS